jgi:hypothetical protein
MGFDSGRRLSELCPPGRQSLRARQLLVARIVPLTVTWERAGERKGSADAFGRPGTSQHDRASRMPPDQAKRDSAAPLGMACHVRSRTRNA